MNEYLVMEYLEDEYLEDEYGDDDEYGDEYGMFFYIYILCIRSYCQHYIYHLIQHYHLLIQQQECHQV